MNLKLKPGKRVPGTPAPRVRVPVPEARKGRGPDLGDRRLQLLLAAVR